MLEEIVPEEYRLWWIQQLGYNSLRRADAHLLAVGFLSIILAARDEDVLCRAEELSCSASTLRASPARGPAGMPALPRRPGWGSRPVAGCTRVSGEHPQRLGSASAAPFNELILFLIEVTENLVRRALCTCHDQDTRHGIDTRHLLNQGIIKILGMASMG